MRGAGEVTDDIRAKGDQNPASLGSHVRPLILLWLAGVALRATILALPPVLNKVSSELSLGGFDVGVLTAIPSLFFALAAVLGAVLVARVGATYCLLIGLLINAFGAGARGFTETVSGLELATGTMCLGVAIMQPAMPSLVRSWIR